MYIGDKVKCRFISGLLYIYRVDRIYVLTQAYLIYPNTERQVMYLGDRVDEGLQTVYCIGLGLTEIYFSSQAYLLTMLTDLNTWYYIPSIL